MKLLSATVVDGGIQLPEGSADDGATVTVLVPDAEERGFEVSTEEKGALIEAIDEADRGAVVDGWNLLDRLKA